jgi:hypothetical protein
LAEQAFDDALDKQTAEFDAYQAFKAGELLLKHSKNQTKQLKTEEDTLKK